MVDKSCEFMLGSLSDYVDGVAGESICREIERHLSDCENCRVVVDTLKKTITLYQSTSDIDIPQDVRSRLLVRLDLDEYINPNN